ncbi:MAG: Ig-like domain-containing protein [bacterium]|jgi:hypothetical protein
MRTIPRCLLLLGALTAAAATANLLPGGLAAGAVFSPPRADKTAPAVSVGAIPSVVGGVITIAATATDNVGVIGVQFRIDGKAFGAEDRAAPFAITLDTRTLSSGRHTVTAVARDAAGNRRTSAGVSFIVDNRAPQVAITSPASGATLSGKFTATASASDTNGVAGVQFLIDGKPYGAEVTAQPYRAAINAAALASGSHTLAAVARDRAGNTATASITFKTGLSDTVPPAVAVAPLPQIVGGIVALTASATDNTGVAGVQFYIDGNAVGKEVTTPPFTTTIDTDALTSGRHTATARARDAAGNTATSAGVSFIVDNGAPSVAISSPQAGATVNESFTATATASDKNGIAGVQFSIDWRPYGPELTTAPYTATIDTKSLTEGSHTLAAVARDPAGNKATASVQFTYAGSGSGDEPGAKQTVPIVVHAYAGDGPANLVSNSLPFKPGVLFDATNIRVMDDGTEVPVAVKTLATWPKDHSIRAVLLQFNAAFTGTSKQYTIEIGTPRTTTDRAFTAVTWDLPTRIFTLPAAYLSSSLIFWEQKPLGQTNFPAWESKQLANYSRIEKPGTASCVRDDQYYDAITTTYQLYARTGELKHLVNARRWALHHRRDQIYLSGSTIGHPKCSSSYINNTRYTFPEGLINDYFMFGDEEDKRVSGIVVDNFYMPHASSYYYKAPNTRGWWTEREPAFSLIGILAHYQATGNAAYLNKVKERIASLRQMQVDNGRRAWVHNLYDHDPSEGCAVSDYGSSPWMSGLLLEAVITYHKLTDDPVAKESILMALDDLKARYLAKGSYAGVSFVYLGCPAYRDGTPDLDNMISHAFGYGYKLTGNPEYLKVGTDIFNTSVKYGVTSSHKHYNQQFRSSGHFVGYIGQ